MARKQKTNTADDIMYLVALMPWWAGVTLAFAFYFWLHGVATQDIALNTTPGQLGVSVAMSMWKALASVDVVIKEPFEAAFERSDICAVAAAAVVGEAMVAITLADALLEKFGGDSVRELVRNVTTYKHQLEEY